MQNVLRELAKDHPLADYLLFAADVVESQLSVFEKNPLEKQHFDNLDELEPLNTKHLNAQAFGLNISKKFYIALNQKRMNRFLLRLRILKRPLIKILGLANKTGGISYEFVFCLISSAE